MPQSVSQQSTFYHSRSRLSNRPHASHGPLRYQAGIASNDFAATKRSLPCAGRILSSDRIRARQGVAALLLLLVAMMGPWFTDSHPATEESCSAPLVWLGSGHCACLVSLMAAFRESFRPGQVLCLLLALPFLSTLLLLLGRERRYLWVSHLTAWGLAAILSIVALVAHWRHVGAVSFRLWGVWLCAVAAIAVLAEEILAARRRPGREASPAGAGVD